MLRIQRCILARLLSSSPASPVSPLQRLLSAAAPRISPNPSFDVAEYLVGNCGLTRVQALKASPKISHLKSPTNPDAVLGLSCADVAAIVAKDPKFLCAKVERTLAPNVADLAGVGLPHTEIALLVSRDPGKFRCRFIVSNLPYCVSLFGSYENVLRAIKHGSYLLHCDLEDTVKPNVALLQGCGLDACDIAKLGLSSPWLLTANMEQVRTMVACAEGIGVPRRSGMFRTALPAVAFQSKREDRHQSGLLEENVQVVGC
uniref:Uncharacterized protein n=1 Tax=Avena sativa TaxID=4498 RepID=A0ACD5V7D4_AVESA